MKKPLLFMLPGLLCDERLFTHQIDALQKKFEIKVPNFSPFSSITAMADFVLKEAEGRSFYLMGFSMGGYVALEVLARAPKQILKLALVNTSAFEDDAQTRKKRKRLIAQVSGKGTFKGVTTQLIKRLVAPNSLTKKPEIFELLQNMTTDFGKEVYIRHQTAILNRTNQIDILKKTTLPILIITSEFDAIISPEESKIIAAQLPHAQFEIIQGVGHMPPIEAPHKLTNILSTFFQN